MKIQAAVARKQFEPFTIETLELDEPRTDEVLVRIAAVGVCHTDLVFRDQETGLVLPAVMGHEGAGVVVQVGSAIKNVIPGDHVLITFRSCGACQRCVQHLPGYCQHFPAMNFSGTRSDGSKALRAGNETLSSNFFGQSSFATHALTYERNLVKISEELNLSTYAPLGCGVQTGAGSIIRSMVCPRGSSVVIIGAGAVGLSAVLAAAMQGCAPLIVVEPRAERRSLAREFGATHTVDPRAGDVVQAVRAIVPTGAEFVFDSSGFIPAIEAALGYLASHGTLGLVGASPETNPVLKLPLAAAVTFGFIVKGIIEGDSDPVVFIPELIREHRAGRFPFDKMVSKYRFDDINQALEDQHAGRCVKAVLVMDDVN